MNILDEKNRTDNRVFFRRPDLTIYAVLAKGRLTRMRKANMLDSFLERERDSGVVIEKASL